MFDVFDAYIVISMPLDQWVEESQNARQMDRVTGAILLLN